MTDPEMLAARVLKPTKADRDAAMKASRHMKFAYDPARMESGGYDLDPLVLLFANHRPQPLVAGDLREAVARTVDRTAFSEAQRRLCPSPEWATREREALTKADAILGLISAGRGAVVEAAAQICDHIAQDRWMVDAACETATACAAAIRKMADDR